MTVTIIYAVIVIAISAILLKRTKGTPEKRTPVKRAAAIIVSVMLFLSLPIVMFADQAIDVLWFRFDDKRIAEVEEVYGIDIDDDIKLKKYIAMSWQDGPDCKLYFEYPENGKAFFEKYCDGRVEEYFENGKYHSVYDEGFKLPDEQSYPNVTRYQFKRSDNVELNVEFTMKKDESGYNCVMYIHKDRDVEQ